MNKISGEAGVRILSTLFLLLLARKIGAADFGCYSSAWAFASVFMILVDLGMSWIITREVARNSADQSGIIGAGNLLKLIASGLALTLIHLSAVLTGLAHDQIQM